MNLVIFFSISRFLGRNLRVLKLRQNLKVQTLSFPYLRIVPINIKENQDQRKHEITRLNRDSSNDEGHQNNHKWSGYLAPGKVSVIVSGVFSFGFFGNSKDEESPEDKLVTTIKRSVLCIQRQEFDKAEQMLHLALRMAQDLQSKEGITYIYDLMANLAMEQEQYKKAEKLFVDVMRRLFNDGYSKDSAQIMHISAKLAHMAQLQGELDKALQGFTWTLQRIEEHLKKDPSDKDILELLGLTKNWFGQLQMKLGKYADAKNSFQEAYDALVEVYGRVNEEAVTILNNLSVACVNLEEYELAKKYLTDALELVKELKDTAQEGILQANLGLIYLREGLIMKAKEACSLAWRIGKKGKNVDAVEQAEYCLNEIKTFIQ
ncbi:PREDICTED: tetratricopeptide repeat protein 19 homolog, mitochondrial isoform X2 [Rhagoletis zephyria]|uniref:tetratricopeptide repeat protein 19 homolog, mitochondrial isoform X2 n=1 Tax=Rhagoletis zephyria TaxID=28612 RepID=UPI00081145E3|nr:PREDICTED: tetratricopeptide repeat protein 19 homolog, mitochondrial isoform X2 [Rhagoletis zephyria]XP_036343924.1 tetratricopeptide repeat protein 19 homolog, mitochondrial-like isoform X2 [Rhagoletis pomonella]XP_036343933.1 tetratricopeptide repeat protein 19 homolog, mitochondrial-like isoform X2 [Rhagoletis pomonella]